MFSLPGISIIIGGPLHIHLYMFPFKYQMTTDLAENDPVFLTIARLGIEFLCLS